MSATTRTYDEVLGDWVADHAENVQDMGRRVVEVVGRNPGDHHYASNKLGYALEQCARALTLVGWTADELANVVREMHEAEGRNKRELKREFAEASEEPETAATMGEGSER